MTTTQASVIWVLGDRLERVLVRFPDDSGEAYGSLVSAMAESWHGVEELYEFYPFGTSLDGPAIRISAFVRKPGDKLWMGPTSMKVYPSKYADEKT